MLGWLGVRAISLKSGCSSMVEHQLPNSRSHLTNFVTSWYPWSSDHWFQRVISPQSNRLIPPEFLSILSFTLTFACRGAINDWPETVRMVPYLVYPVSLKIESHLLATRSRRISSNGGISKLRCLAGLLVNWDTNDAFEFMYTILQYRQSS